MDWNTIVKDDFRWATRFSDFKEAFQSLKKADLFYRDTKNRIETPNEYWLELIRSAVIQHFYCTYEQASNVMRDMVYQRKKTTVSASRDAIKECFAMGIMPEKSRYAWGEMIQTMEIITTAYDINVAISIFGEITNKYIPIFEEFEQLMEYRIITDSYAEF